MAGFSPIQTVDVGGLIGVYEGAKDRRMNQLLLQRKIAAEDRQIEREAKIAAAYKNLFSPQSKGGDPTSTGSGATASVGASGTGYANTRAEDEAAAEANGYRVGVPNMTGGPPPPVRMNEDGSVPVDIATGTAPQTLVDPTQLAPRTDGMVINPDALRELYGLDPKAAFEIQKHVYDANAAQLKRMTENGERIASVAYHLMQVPAANRASELQAMAPMLAQSGIDASMLSQADLSDQGLQRYLRVGQSYKDLIKDDRDERDFAERKRHNQATEAAAQGNLEVRRGALGLARDKEGRVAKGATSGDVTGLSTDALIRMATGGN